MLFVTYILPFLFVEIPLQYPWDCILSRKSQNRICLKHITLINKDDGKQKQSAYKSRMIDMYSSKERTKNEVFR